MKSDILESFKDKKILLVGDTILDVYIYNKLWGKALDASVPEIEEVETKISFGGNSLIASHILELGGEVRFITVLGDDQDRRYYDSFSHPKLKKFFLIDPDRRTTVKRRWYLKGQKLLQANQVDHHSISRDLEQKIMKEIEVQAKMIDIIVVMDPHHGVLTKNIVAHLKKVSQKFGKPIYADSQFTYNGNNHSLYNGVDCLFLNEKEAKVVYPKFSLNQPEISLEKIRRKLKLNSVIVKTGEKGSIALINNQYIKTKPHKIKVVDVCGAGDAFLAAFSLGDRNQPEESLKLANLWAGLSTEIHGTIPPRKKDLIKALQSKRPK